MFDTEWYRAVHNLGPDADPRKHYFRHRRSRAINPNPYFDAEWYLQTNPDVARSGADPLAHFLSSGAAEGRDPGPRFSTLSYLRRYPDVERAGVNPLVHFIRHGIAEGRAATPASDLWRQISDRVARVIEQAPLRQKDLGHFINPLHHVDLDDRPSRYHATGSDPQLLVDVAIPAGFFRIRLSIEYANIPLVLVEQSSLQIYVEDVNGFREMNSWSYAISENAVDIDDLLFNEFDVYRFRLDPIDTVASFHIKNLEIKPVNIETAINDLVDRVQDRHGVEGLGPQRLKDEFRPESLAQFVRGVSSSEPLRPDPYQYWISMREAGSFDFSKLIKKNWRSDTSTNVFDHYADLQV